MQEELTPMNSGFRADTNLDITAVEFAMMSASIESLFEANIQLVRPIKYRYYDIKTNELVLSPTQEGLDKGELRREFDPLAFMNPGNVMEAYVGDVSPVIMEALRARFDIHDRGIEAGKAVLNDILIKELEEKKTAEAKPKLEIVND